MKLVASNLNFTYFNMELEIQGGKPKGTITYFKLKDSLTEEDRNFQNNSISLIMGFHNYEKEYPEIDINEIDL